MTPKARQLRDDIRLGYAPPPDIRLSEWAEQNIVLPVGQSARPGKYRNWPYFRAILDDIGDPEVERVTLMKGTRLGFTKGLMVAIAATAINEPSPMILLVPTQEDARDYVSDEVEPIFEATEALADALIASGRGARSNNVLSARGGSDVSTRRSTLTRKRFRNGASLKILAARAPRSLRRHDAKWLFIDEADAMEITVEGDPLLLAERRTMAHADRKIVIGSTPTEEGLSNIDRRYAESDQRVFEVPCPNCGSFFEIIWSCIRWPEGRPQDAALACPHCEAHAGETGGELTLIDEEHKQAMVEAGRWRPLKPEVEGHHGYRVNAMVSMLANARWGILAKEFVEAKRGGPAELQVFANTVEGRVWRTSLNQLSADLLAERAEAFDLDHIPAWVLLITVGADVQDERIEATVMGWGLTGKCAALGHLRVEGNTLNTETWAEFDKRVLKRTFRHPNGWAMRVDAAAVDSGGSEGRTQVVYNFCRQRLVRRVFAIAGRTGARPIWAPAKKVKGGAPLFIVGHDQVKTAVMQRLSADPEKEPHVIRLSESLDYDWFEQATGEIRRIRYVRNRSVIEFVPRRPGQRVEALDCLCYAWAVRQAPAVKSIDLVERSNRRADGDGKPRSSSDFAAALNG